MSAWEGFEATSACPECGYQVCPNCADALCGCGVLGYEHSYQACPALSLTGEKRDAMTENDLLDEVDRLAAEE